MDDNAEDKCIHFTWCIINYHKLSGSEQHTLSYSFHGSLAGSFTIKVLVGNAVSSKNQGTSSKLTHIVARIQVLAAGGVRLSTPRGQPFP